MLGFKFLKAKAGPKADDQVIVQIIALNERASVILIT